MQLTVSLEGSPSSNHSLFSYFVGATSLPELLRVKLDDDDNNKTSLG